MIRNDPHGYNAIADLVGVYFDELEPEQLEYDEELGKLAESLLRLHEALEPTWQYDPARLRRVTRRQAANLKTFVGMLHRRFEDVGASPEAVLWFERICGLCWQLDPGWRPPELLEIRLNQQLLERIQLREETSAERFCGVET